MSAPGGPARASTEERKRSKAALEGVDHQFTTDLRTSDQDASSADVRHAVHTLIEVTPHEISVWINGLPHLLLRRSDVIGVQGYIKNVGPAQPIFFIEITTKSGEIVSDYADRRLWEEILGGLARAKLFDERLGEHA